MIYCLAVGAAAHSKFKLHFASGITKRGKEKERITHIVSQYNSYAQDLTACYCAGVYCSRAPGAAVQFVGSSSFHSNKSLCSALIDPMRKARAQLTVFLSLLKSKLGARYGDSGGHRDQEANFKII